MRNTTRWPVWVIGGLWFAVGAITSAHNGPFFDEATQITAGLRLFEGHGLSDGYLVWFGGSLFWPLLAGIGYRIGGLTGTRLLALLLAAIAFGGTVRASANLFGRKTALWTALILAANGPLMALARLGVYDVLALGCIGIATWAITELETGDRRYLLIATLGLVGATVAKYPIVLMALPLCGLLVLLRRDRAVVDLGIMGCLSGALFIAFFTPFRQQLAEAPAWQAVNRPDFGVTSQMIAYASLYWTLVPAVMAIAGWRLARERRGIAALLTASLAIWPLFHLISLDPVSLNKTVVFGTMLAAPLGGLALTRLWSRPRYRVAAPLVVLALMALGVVQWQQLDRAWPDARPTARYLVEHVQPGDLLLIDESWPYILYLYDAGRIDSPWDVYDVYRVSHDQSPVGLCEHDWFVSVRGSYAWPGFVNEAIRECALHRQVHTETSWVIGLGTDLRFHTYPVEAIVLRLNDPLGRDER
jgi:4-amino-4-deoxy-L-arabinose transferase-like glycosyltransferase